MIQLLLVLRSGTVQKNVKFRILKHVQKSIKSPKIDIKILTIVMNGKRWKSMEHIFSQKTNERRSSTAIFSVTAAQK